MIKLVLASAILFFSTRSDIRDSRPPDHNLFSEFLVSHVDALGRVDYGKMKKNVATLDGYLSQLKNKHPDGQWSRDAQLAYWINAYNAFTIKLILENYPLKKITDLDDGKVWDRKWIDIGGKRYSLNQIENEIIRPQFSEPRIHFAVNCAARSCPPLANKAFTAENLESLLESRTSAFINNSKYNRISRNRIVVSKIFDWYSSDFGDLISFINKYSDLNVASDSVIEFADYDWQLNSN